VEDASHSTCIASPEAYLSFYESDDFNQKMAQDVKYCIHIASSEAILVKCEPYSTLESGSGILKSIWAT
jgi:hypothetical protein